MSHAVFSLCKNDQALVFTNVHPYAHYGDFVRKFRSTVYQALE